MKTKIGGTYMLTGGIASPTFFLYMYKNVCWVHDSHASKISHGNHLCGTHQEVQDAKSPKKLKMAIFGGFKVLARSRNKSEISADCQTILSD